MVFSIECEDNIVLIYVNEFMLKNRGSTNQALNTIGGWLKSKTGESFSIEKLKSGETFSLGHGVHLSTYCATQKYPKMYSILFSHPDENVNGRYWETELAVTEYESHSSFSILLKTTDVSTQVRVIPGTTRPKVVGFLNRNQLLAQDTVGLSSKELGTEITDSDELKSYIFDEKREHPIVLVSSNKNINSGKLQAQLVGLAQVVEIPDGYNTWKLEEELGKEYSCWGGAVNIIYPRLGRTQIGTYLILPNVIDTWIENKSTAEHELLSLVTHSTNRHYRKKHFSPTDVRAKRQKDQRLLLKEQIERLQDGDDCIPLEQFISEIDSIQQGHEDEIKSMNDKVNIAEAMSYEAFDECEVLKNKLVEVEAELDTYKGVDGSKVPLLCKGEENDLFEGELTYHALSAIVRAVEESKENSRRNHVLRDLLAANTLNEEIETNKATLKQLLSSYKALTNDIKDALGNFNIEVETDSGHHKAKFINDERYTVTFSKTPSCGRAGKNINTDINKEFF